MPTEASRPVVFVSYSHDSDEHRASVIGLGSSLTGHGCDCRLDVHKDTDEDWPSWMKRQLCEADFVLCVSSRTYERRFDDQELPDIGQGVGWEAGLIRRLLYKKKLHNDRIFPVFFDSTDKGHIPLELLGFDQFHLNGQDGYEDLLRKIHHRPRYAKPDLGAIPELPTQPSNPTHSLRPDSGATEPADISLFEVRNDTSVPDDEENRKTRQARQFPKMVEALDKKKDASDAFSESLRNFVNDTVPLDDTKSLVKAFNALTNDDATKCINNAFKKLCKRKNTGGAADIGGFVEAWLSVVYEHPDKIAKIRSDLSNPKIATVTVPTKLPVATEITMAEAEEGLVRLELSARNELVSRLNLGSFGELGLDEDGKEQQRQLYDLLSRRFLKASDRPGLERTVRGLVGAIGKYHDSQGELSSEDTAETLRKKLAGILRDLYETIDRRYYLCLEVGDDFNLDVFKTLKADYPTLAFLVSSCADEVGEADRYRKLSRIIATAKGDTTLCEEIAKNA